MHLKTPNYPNSSKSVISEYLLNPQSYKKSQDTFYLQNWKPQKKSLFTFPLKPKTLEDIQKLQMIITWKTRLALSLSVYSGGESTGAEFVNFLSNCDTSSSLVSLGLNGGSNFRAMTSFQLICLKKRWFLTGSASQGPDPSLWGTCRFNSFLMRSRESGVKYGGRMSFPLRILSIVFLRLSEVKGGAPVEQLNLNWSSWYS